MKNTLIYFYNINIDRIQKINNDYYFLYQDNNFILAFYNRDLSEVDSIYLLNQEMLSSGTNTYEIIPTVSNNIVSFYEGNYYLLMRIPNIRNRLITLKDLLTFRYVPINNKIIKDLNKSNWGLIWENKIDYYEKQFVEIERKHPVILESINYYVGMWENAISYYNDTVSNKLLEVCNKRAAVNMDLLTYFNPLNLVVDDKVRDISEYMKSYIYNKNFTVDIINNTLNNLNLNQDKALLLITRTLFPSNYFDFYEDIIIDHHDEAILANIIDKRNNHLVLLKCMFKYFSKYNIPYVNWITKEDYY